MSIISVTYLACNAVHVPATLAGDRATPVKGNTQRMNNSQG